MELENINPKNSMPRSYTLESEILKVNITKVLILLKEWEAYCQILDDYMLNTHVRMSRVFTKKITAIGRTQTMLLIKM